MSGKGQVTLRERFTRIEFVVVIFVVVVALATISTALRGLLGQGGDREAPAISPAAEGGQ